MGISQLVVDQADTPPIIIGSNPHWIHHLFLYLASKVSNTGDVYRKWELLAGDMKGLWKPLWRHCDISWCTKLRVYNATIFSVWCQDVTSQQDHHFHVHCFVPQILRTIKRVHWSDLVSIEEFCEGIIYQFDLPSTKLVTIHLLEGHHPPGLPAYSGSGRHSNTLQRPCLERQGCPCGFKVFMAWDLAVATESKWFWDWHWW